MNAHGAVGEMKALFGRLKDAQVSAWARSSEALGLACAACEILEAAGAMKVDGLTSITMTTPGRAQLKARLAVSPEDSTKEVGLDRGDFYQIPNRVDVTVECGGSVCHLESIAVVDTAERLAFTLVRREADDEERNAIRARTERGGTIERLTRDWIYQAVARAARPGEALVTGETPEHALAERWARALVAAETGEPEAGETPLEHEEATATCQSCDWHGPADDCPPLRRLTERVPPGDIMPAGECPECGASAMLDEPERWR